MEAFDTAEDRAFRQQARAFFAKSLPEDIKRAITTWVPDWHRT